MDNVLKKENFIKPNRKIHTGYSGENLAPMFRKKFNVEEPGAATVYLHSPGYAYCYINGQLITEDKFVSAVSDYNKTLWVHKYDVTGLIKKGENVICVWCGNGWYNEEFTTIWHHEQAEWRDVPKFVLKLDIGTNISIVSDSSWLCKPESAIFFNALRSGEYFDSRMYDDNWTTVDYDDSDWESAVKDETPPKGSFRLCECEPIREFEEYETKCIYKSGDEKYVFDIGQNISGYIRLQAKGNCGDVLTIRYAEEMNED